MSLGNILELGKKGDGKIILGQTDGLIRLDIHQNALMQKMISDSEGNTWFTKEVSFKNDKWGKLCESSLFVMENNIGYQTIMDSGVSNGYLDVTRRCITDHEYKEAYTRVGIEEIIHAKSYSTGLNLIFNSESSKILNRVLSDPFIKSRMDHEIDAFKKVGDILTNFSYKQLYNQEVNDQEMHDFRVAFVQMIIHAYLLEGIKFPFSFYNTVSINKNYSSAVQGFRNLIRFIAHDELTYHVPLNLHMMKHLRKSDIEGFTYLFEENNQYFDGLNYEDWVIKQTETICKEELDFSDFLLQKGEFLGSTRKGNEHIIKYYGNLRLSGLKLPSIYDKKLFAKNDTIRWFERELDISNDNAAGQETDLLSYQKGGMTNDLNDDIIFLTAR